ncbi:MAG: PDZ domain-containing protein [Aureliella sp.]
MPKQRLCVAALFPCLVAAAFPATLYSQESPHQHADYIATIVHPTDQSHPSSEPTWRIDLSSPYFEHKDAAKLDCKVCHMESTDEQAAYAWAYTYAQEYLRDAPAPGQQIGRYVVANLVDDILRSHLKLGKRPVLTVLASHAVTREDEDTAVLQRGDLILASEELDLTDTVAFAEQCEKTDQEKIKLTILRAGERLKVSVPSPQLQSPKPPLQFGVQVEDASEVLRTQLGLFENEGIVVTEVVEGSAAEEAGIRVHDVLLRADSLRLSTLENLREAAQASRGNAVTLVLVRGGKEQPLRIQPKRAEAVSYSVPCPASAGNADLYWSHTYTPQQDSSTLLKHRYLNDLYGTVKAALESGGELQEDTSLDEPASKESP